jgi:hypothetical protein
LKGQALGHNSNLNVILDEYESNTLYWLYHKNKLQSFVPTIQYWLSKQNKVDWIKIWYETMHISESWPQMATYHKKSLESGETRDSERLNWERGQYCESFTAVFMYCALAEAWEAWTINDSSLLYSSEYDAL